MSAFTDPASVRNYLVVEGDPLGGQFSDEIIEANIETASDYLQFLTGRQFEPRDAVTLRISTRGASYVMLPDLRAVTAVRLDGTTISSDDYSLITDAHEPAREMIVAIQLYRYRYLWRRRPRVNDLEVDGDAGWEPLPTGLVQATNVLAAWLTKRPDAILTNTLQTGEGNVLDLSRLPPEVWKFKQAWDHSPVMVA